MSTAQPRTVIASYTSPGALLFFTIHAAALYALIAIAPSSTSLALCLGLFVIRKFGITGGYHRYFSHRSYKTSRPFQFVLAWLGGMAAQKGALWWAAHHRHHHQHSDQEEDIHSVKQQGFYWAHIGWILAPDYFSYDAKRVKDLTRFPELVWLDRWHFVPPAFTALACWLIDGKTGLFWGFCVSTVILYHTTFAINSFCHLLGRQRYLTGESSKNSLILALLTLGEGWHNNHHYYPHSARQGFYWWEIDLTYYALRALALTGLVRDIHEPSRKVIDSNHLGAEGVAQAP